MTKAINVTTKLIIPLFSVFMYLQILHINLDSHDKIMKTEFSGRFVIIKSGLDHDYYMGKSKIEPP